MRIVQIEKQRGWAGQAQQSFLTARSLHERGHNVLVVCRPTSNIGKYAAKEGIKVLYMPIKRLGFSISIIKLILHFWRNRYDIVHCHGSRDHFLAVIASLLSPSGKVIRTKHNHTRVKGGLGAIMQYKWFTHKLIGVSKIACELLQQAGIPSKKIKLIHDGCDVTVFKQQEPDPEILKGIGIKDDDVVVGIVGRLYSKRKGASDLLRAAPIIIKEAPRARFLFVGQISSEILRLTESLAFKDRVIFTGFRKDVPQIISCMDICVTPSLEEALGFTIVQAMAMAKPVVATCVGGIPEVVVDGQTGLLCDPGNPNALAQSILKLIRDPGARHQMGIRGRERAVKDFSLDRMTDEIENVYRNVIQK